MPPHEQGPGKEVELRHHGGQGRQHGRDQQDAAAHEGGVGRDGMGKHGKPAARFPQGIAALPGLVHGQQGRCGQQRQDEVDQAEQQHRRENGLLARGMRQVQDDQLEDPHATGHMGQHHGHLRHEIAGQKVDETDAQVTGQQHIHAGGGGDQVHPGHDHLGHGDAGDGEDEFLAEDMHRLADGEAQHQIGKGDGQQDASQKTHVMDGHLGQQFVGDHGRRQQEDHAAQAQGAHPERDGQHEHQADDLRQGKAPCRIEAVTDARAAQQGPEVVADGLPHQGDQPHAGQGQ